MNFKTQKKQGQLSLLASALMQLATGPKGSRLPERDVLNAIIDSHPSYDNESAARISSFYTAWYFLHTWDRDLDPAIKSLLHERVGFSAISEKSFCDFVASLPQAGPLPTELILELLNKKSASQKTCHQLGQMLLEGKLNESWSGVLLTTARLKLESQKEYAGFLSALNEKLAWKGKSDPDRPTIVVNEPFDGMSRSHYYSPFLPSISKILNYDYRFLYTGSPKLAPKFGMGIGEVLAGLDFKKVGNEADWQSQSGHACYADVEDYLPALHRLNSLRTKTMKRSFLATLERLTFPVSANVLITSAFHGPYPEKMIELGLMQGARLVICLRKGDEGSLSVRRGRSVFLYSGLKQNFDAPTQKAFFHYQYVQNSWKVVEQENYWPQNAKVEPISREGEGFVTPSAEKNIREILDVQKLLTQNKIADIDFGPYQMAEANVKFQVHLLNQVQRLWSS